MYFSSKLRSTLKSLTLSALAVAALVSCSASQTVYDDDGIYSSSATGVEQEENREIVSTSTNSNKYKDYFEEGARRLEDIPEEGAIFTDIESYTSEGDDGEYYDDGVGYETGRAAWGEETENVVVNIYNDVGFGWGFNRWGWNNWGWNAGFGWGGGWGFNAWNPFCYGNGFYNRPYFNNAFHNGYAYNRGGRGVAYNSGRRTSASRAVAESRSRLRSNRNARNVVSRSRATYSRNRGTARPNGINRNGRVYRDGVSRGRPNGVGRPSNGARPNVSGRPNSSRPQGNTTRPSRPSRPQGTARPSRPSSRPSARPSRPSSRPSARPSRPSSRPSSASRGGGFSRSSGSRGGSSRGGGRRG